MKKLSLSYYSFLPQSISKTKYNFAVLAFVLSASLLTVFNVEAQEIPVLELPYSVITDEESANFLTLVAEKCVYSKVINDVNSANTIFLGSYDFVYPHIPEDSKKSFKPTGLYLLSIRTSGIGGRGHSIMSVNSLDQAADSFAETICKANETLKRILNKRLPIFVKKDPSQFRDCQLEYTSHCAHFAKYRGLLMEIEDMILHKGFNLAMIENDQNSMPYELNIKFVEKVDNDFKIELVLSRNLNGAVVGNQTKKLSVYIDPLNTQLGGSVILKDRIAIMSWLAEKVENQEWKEESVLEEAGANK